MSFQFLLSKEFAVALLVVAAAIEAVGADMVLGQTYRLDKVFQMGELQRGETQTASYLIHHALVFWRVGLGILVELGLVVALEVADNATCDEFQVAL